jgi:hypothetical protein
MPIVMNTKNQIILRVSGNKIHAGDLAGSATNPDWGKFTHAQLSLSPNLASIPFKAGMLAGSVQGLEKSIEVVLAAHQLRPLASNSVVAGEVTIVFQIPHPFQAGVGRISKKKMLQIKTAACRMVNELFGTGVAAILFRIEGNRFVFQVFVVPIVSDEGSSHMNFFGHNKSCSPTWKLSAHEFFSRKNLIDWQQRIRSQKNRQP